MFKSLLTAAVLALGISTSAVSAHDPQPQPPVPQVPAAPSHVTVFVRKCEHEPWQRQGCYNCIHDAQAAAAQLQAQGLLVDIR